MTVEQFALKQINILIPEYDSIDLEIFIDDISYSVDFLVTINGKRKQCLDLIDEGIISNKAYEETAEIIAKYARTSDNYKTGCINKYKTSGI